LKTGVYTVNKSGKPIIRRSTVSHALRIALGLSSMAVLSACGGGADGATAAPVSLGAALPDDGDFIAITQQSVSLSEAARTGSVQVSRLGSAQGETRVSFRFVSGTASASSDFRGTDGTLTWASGESGDKTVSFIVESDIEAEANEEFRIEISNVSGNESLGVNDSVSVIIEDAACSAAFPASTGSNTTLSAPCYHLQQDAVVSSSAQLQVAAGTTIVADPGTSVSLQDQSSLHMEGTDNLPVFIKSANGQAGAWNGFQLNSSSPLHHVRHVDINDAVNAFTLTSGGFAVFNNNALVNNTAAGVKLPLDHAETLGTNNHFDATTRGIELVADSIDANQTVRVPEQSTHYVLSGGLVNSGTLEISAGVDLRMAADVQILVLASGAISAIGTSDKPIAIQGLLATPGYWNGIQYVSSTSENNTFQHVRISHGGGDPVRAGNIIVDGLNTRITMQDCEITHSAGFGLVYDSGAFQVDLTDVTFELNRLGDQSL